VISVLGPCIDTFTSTRTRQGLARSLDSTVMGAGEGGKLLFGHVAPSVVPVWTPLRPADNSTKRTPLVGVVDLGQADRREAS
jgi:hypothetical protein